jgi:microcystin-dependent protein
MAQDFPASPVDGQVFSNFTYDGTVGVWRNTPDTASGLPAGSIMAWGGSTAPANWLICDGSAISRSNYASLFNAIGTQYGTGDGSTTFNLPDLRGRVPVGKNAATFGTLGATGGSETVTLIEANLPSHTHTGTTAGAGNHTHTFSGSTNTTGAHTHSLSGSNGGSANLGPSVTSNSNGDFGYLLNGGRANSAGDHSHTYSGTTSDISTTHTHTFTTNATGSGTAVNNLQPYQIVNYIIKTSAGITAGDSQLASRVGVLENTGSANINTLGTITTGTWNATPIDITKGGSGTTLGAGGVSMVATSVGVDAGSASVSAAGVITFSGVTNLGLNGIFNGNYQNYDVINLTPSYKDLDSKNRST